jgi:hypothetical protein
MAEADRQRLLERALSLPLAKPADFAGGRRPPAGAEPDHLRRIDDTTLRTKLVESGLAEGLQSPKGPQKISSIVRIYPNFDAPPKVATGRAKRGPAKGTGGGARPALPTVDEMERLLARLHAEEEIASRDLARSTDDRISLLKRTLVDLDGDDLENTYRELGAAIESRRAQRAQARNEAFRRIESDSAFPERVYLRLLRR